MPISLPPPDHTTKHGVFYNSQLRPGIRYIKKSKAELQGDGFTIKLNAKERPIPEKPVKVVLPPSEILNPPKKRVVVKPKPKIDYKKKYSKPANPGDYVISINGQSVNFSAEGIKRPKLKRSERKWIEKASYYFVNVTESNRKIGSAAVYTQPEALEALWATAEQYDIDPKRFIVQIFNETRFNPHLKGRAGERGIGQFKHATAKSLGYDWNKMKAGIVTYAYQAKCAAEHTASVGESTYNGGNRGSRKYVKRISKHMIGISRTKIPDTTVAIGN